MRGSPIIQWGSVIILPAFQILSVVFVSPLLFSLRRSFATVSIWKKPTVSGRPPNTPYWLTGRYKEPLCSKVQDSRGCAVLSSAIPAGPFFVFGALSGSLLTIPTNASWTPVEHLVNGKDIFIKFMALIQNKGHTYTGSVLIQRRHTLLQRLFQKIGRFHNLVKFTCIFQ